MNPDTVVMVIRYFLIFMFMFLMLFYLIWSIKDCDARLAQIEKNKKEAELLYRSLEYPEWTENASKLLDLLEKKIKALSNR